MILKDKVAIITGASRGIGKAIAMKFAQEGAKVICNYNQSKEQAEQLLKEIKEYNEKSCIFQADVSEASDVEKLVNYVEEEYGRIDILVNNAGIVIDKFLMMYKNEDWDLTLQTNLSSTYYCTKAVIRPMLMNRYGRIINLSSTSGINGQVGQCSYSATKAGIIGFSKSIAREIGRYNINVNVIAPGFIETDMTKNVSTTFIERYRELSPLARIGKPEEVANVCLFLASDAASYIHGQTIVVDGGMGI